ncbi:hypothetical protein OG906_02795 [Streptomyces sp. NBC_01426]|uniref:hypothetical protein n=1 Tax=Streptomyces sp. NBC_01426 TaxID=2975866 RepID=UPI002E35EFAF|nr:hypothetical protein [Streptomyces sp. NBC_01426]
MTTFRQHMQERVVQELAEIPDALKPGIHAVTFRIDSVAQDPRLPYLAFGYVTEDHVDRQLTRPDPPEEWEARWSYAYFPPSALEGVRILGHDHVHDPRGSELHHREAVAEGLWWEGEDEDGEEERAERLDAAFHALCVDLARELHEGGHLVAALGRPVPVVLYDMFAPDEMFELTRAANPPELVADFLSGEQEG